MANTKVYNGWRLYKSVTIIKPSSGDKAYVADASDSSQLSTGHRWAGTGYREETLDNRGFKLRLMDSPGRSYSQGGKLSFCMCEVIRDDSRWEIGIDTEMLIEILKMSTCINGEIQNELMFARRSGKLGMIAMDSEFYEQAMTDKEIREKVSKTRKPKPGYLHEALTVKSVYMFDIRSFVSEGRLFIESKPDHYSYSMRRNIFTVPLIEIHDEPEIKHLYPEVPQFNNAGFKLDDYINNDKGVVSMQQVLSGNREFLIDWLNKMKKSGSVDRVYNTYQYDRILFASWSEDATLVKKFPTRALGKQIMDVDVDENAYNKYIDDIMKEFGAVDEKTGNNNLYRSTMIKTLLGYRFGDGVTGPADIDTVKKLLESSPCCCAVKIKDTMIYSKALQEKLDSGEYKISKDQS